MLHKGGNLENWIKCKYGESARVHVLYKRRDSNRQQVGTGKLRLLRSFRMCSPARGPQNQRGTCSLRERGVSSGQAPGWVNKPPPSPAQLVLWAEDSWPSPPDNVQWKT